MDVRRAIAALLLLGLLVSCSDDEPSSDPPDPTASATPTSTAPARACDSCRSAGEREASAKAFVRYWFDVFNYAVNSGDPALLCDQSAGECITCKAFRRNIDEGHADGGGVPGRRVDSHFDPADPALR